jgi:hypothetical protein
VVERLMSQLNFEGESFEGDPLRAILAVKFASLGSAVAMNNARTEVLNTPIEIAIQFPSLRVPRNRT